MRRRNLITAAEMPYAAPALSPGDAPARYDSGDYIAVFERCLAEIGWTEQQAMQGRTIGRVRHGFGLACHVESGGGGTREHARLTVEADGVVAVHAGSSAAGQGIATCFAQIAADALGLPLSGVRVRLGSTDLLPDGVGSFHGRSLVMGGCAILDAAAKLLAHLPAGAGPETLAAGVSADGVFARAEMTYSYGTHAAHVTVDVDTGEVRVMAYIAVDDAGRVVNPLIVRGQKHGAVVQGIGGTLMEHLVYDDTGQLLSGSFADYAVPRAADVPPVSVTVLELCPSPGNPLGAKGAGEDSIGPVAAAIGVQPLALPLTAQRVRALTDAVRGCGAPP